MLGLGCAGAVPTLQRASDFVRAHPGRVALMLALEICSASYYFDNTLETAIGNAICGDGAAAFLLSAGPGRHACYPEIVDFGSFLDPEHLDKVGFGQREGNLRIILSSSVRHLAAPMIANAADPLLRRNCLGRSYIRFSAVHPGGPKVIDNVQEQMGLTEAQLQFSRNVMRNYGNMSSSTVMYVLDEVCGRRRIIYRPRMSQKGLLLVHFRPDAGHRNRIEVAVRTHIVVARRRYYRAHA